MSSIQFRSRIKPAFNYSSAINSYGVCCGITGNNKTIKSFTECFNEGGHFIPTPDGNTAAAICPEPDTRLGCCCSCQYVASGQLNQVPTLTNDGSVVTGQSPLLTSGFTGNVARCDCERKGGKWKEGPCPDTLNDIIGSDSYWKNYCLQGITIDNNFRLIDARSPRSCCHLEFDSETGWPTTIICKDVCTPKDCGDLSTETYPSIFGPGRCSIPLYEGQPTTNCISNTNSSLLATRSTSYQGLFLGSCYTLGPSGDGLAYQCSITPESQCSGYWVVQQNQQTPYCITDYRPSDPVKINGRYQPQVMTETTFDSFGLSVGDNFQGGIYIGKFQTPNFGSTSIVYGNINFGDPVEARYSPFDNIGDSYSKWALIVDEIPYTVSFLNSAENTSYDTSLFDGYYNIYGNGTNFYGIQTALANTLRYQNRYGFIDYYLPSIYELQFYAAYLKRNNVTNLGVILSSSMFNTKYIGQGNSTLVGINSFVYGQVIDPSNSINYQTILLNSKNLYTAFFFRRIVLT